MAKYQRNSFTSGKWATKSELYDKGIKQAKIVSETNPEPSNFPDSKGNPQMQDVCKAQFEGMNEAMKVSLNRATINALVEAFGEDSKNWQGHNLGLEIDKLPGKKFPLYLIPDGFKRIEDDAGYSVIVKEDQESVQVAPEDNGEVGAGEIPF